MKCFGARMIAGLLLLFVREVTACTTFCSREPLLFGKNYDWSLGEGLLIVNKREVQKEALTEDRPARWTSRFGSVTFNQYGREFPNGGMNERGLVVELMWLDETEYPAPTRDKACRTCSGFNTNWIPPPPWTTWLRPTSWFASRAAGKRRSISWWPMQREKWRRSNT